MRGVNSDIFISPQEDYREWPADEAAHINHAAYQCLPQVRRWILCQAPGQMLFGVGLSHDRHEYDFLFPRSSESYPTNSTICVLIATGQISLHDVKMEYNQSYPYG